jgi:hypothetical protein
VLLWTGWTHVLMRKWKQSWVVEGSNMRDYAYSLVTRHGR